MKRFLLIVLALLLHQYCLADDFDADLTRYAANIHQFSNEYPQEKVYLQFDNTSYVCGDTVWFKAFVVEASSHHRASSRVLYVDLLSADGTILDRKKLPVLSGQADGCMPLTEKNGSNADRLRGALNLPGGFYEIRAYTMNMLNFSESSVFSRVIPVYECADDACASVSEIEYTPPAKKNARKQLARYNSLNVTFYPEGGTLLYGVPCRVAFKVTDETGLGVDATGVLQDTILLQTLHDGMGSFIYTPTVRHAKAMFDYEGHSYSFSLPPTENAGCSMFVSYDDDGYLDVAVRTGTSGKVPLPLGLTLTCRGEVFGYSQINSIDKETFTSFALKDVPEGVCQLVLFSKTGEILASRTVYCRKPSLMPEISVQTDKEIYGPFERVKMSVSLIDGNACPFRDRICVSVRDIGVRRYMHSDDLRSYLLLSSDLKGLVYKPEYYFESDDSAHRAALDLLMLVQGWERYEWKTMAGVSEYTEMHRLEDSLTFNGWVLSPFLMRKMNNVRVASTVIYPDKTVDFFSMKTFQKGYFGLNLRDFYGYADVRISANTRVHRLRGTDCRLMLERSVQPAPRAFNRLELYSLLNPLTSQRQFHHWNAPEVYTEKEDTLPSVIRDYGVLLPDVDIKERVMFRDYDTFQAYDVRRDVEDEEDRAEFTTDLLGYLLRKGISPLSYGSGIVYCVHGDDKATCTALSSNPLMIDSHNVSSVLVFDPMPYDEMEKVIFELYRKSEREFGVASVWEADRSTNRILIDVTLRPTDELRSSYELFDISKRRTRFLGYSSPVDYYSPSYPDGPVFGAIDYRRTLYWNPNLITDQEGKAEVEFYNNSYSQHFDVSAAGITAGGTPYVLDAEF